ncbi:hypothetical protein RIF29_22373 [Crotalaria pallida]|uniref:Uncharacterized protein n=1 Tax=Crotalaria pallida TaxID=3830 RepID=A0AAN9F4V4_CROPI
MVSMAGMKAWVVPVGSRVDLVIGTETEVASTENKVEVVLVMVNMHYSHTVVLVVEASRKDYTLVLVVAVGIQELQLAVVVMAVEVMVVVDTLSQVAVVRVGMDSHTPHTWCMELVREKGRSLPFDVVLRDGSFLVDF